MVAQLQVQCADIVDGGCGVEGISKKWHEDERLAVIIKGLRFLSQVLITICNIVEGDGLSGLVTSSTTNGDNLQVRIERLLILS